MRDHVRRRILLLDRDIASARTAVAMAGEELAARQAWLEEARLRALIAETPLADRDLHQAARGVSLVQGRLRDVEAALVALLSEHRSLRGLLSDGGSGS